MNLMQWVVGFSAHALMLGGPDHTLNPIGSPLEVAKDVRLPNPKYSPPLGSKTRRHPSITIHVPLELVPPESSISMIELLIEGSEPSLLPTSAVPVVSVDEDRHPWRNEHDVWPSL